MKGQDPMKKTTLCICLLLVVLLSSLLSGCTQTRVEKDSEVTLIFQYGDMNICESLSPEESERIKDILDGNLYTLFDGIPSCGFHKTVSLQVGNRTYAIASDTCHYIQDMGNLRYFTVSAEEMDYIHNLFASYGGYFPCV